MDPADCRQLCDSFERELTASGWAPSGRTATSARYERGRCQVAFGAQADGTVSWSVFPTQPPADRYPGVVFTHPNPVPLASFTIDSAGGQLHVSSHAPDRTGKLRKQPFFAGDTPSVLARLCEASDRRVDEFVRMVESPPSA